MPHALHVAHDYIEQAHWGRAMVCAAAKKHQRLSMDF